MAASGSASAQPASQKVALYANVGADLTHYDLDIAGAELIKRETITFFFRGFSDNRESIRRAAV